MGKLRELESLPGTAKTKATKYIKDTELIDHLRLEEIRLQRDILAKGLDGCGVKYDDYAPWANPMTTQGRATEARKPVNARKTLTMELIRQIQKDPAILADEDKLKQCLDIPAKINLDSYDLDDIRGLFAKNWSPSLKSLDLQEAVIKRALGISLDAQIDRDALRHVITGIRGHAHFLELVKKRKPEKAITIEMENEWANGLVSDVYHSFCIDELPRRLAEGHKGLAIPFIAKNSDDGRQIYKLFVLSGIYIRPDGSNLYVFNDNKGSILSSICVSDEFISGVNLYPCKINYGQIEIEGFGGQGDQVNVQTLERYPFVDKTEKPLPAAAA